jgi:hypothetical protein
MSSDLQPSEKIIVTGAALRFAEAIAPITRLDAEAPEEARAVAVRGAVYRVQRRLRQVASDSSETEVMIRVEALAAPKPEDELVAVLAELGGDPDRVELSWPEARFVLLPETPLTDEALKELGLAINEAFDRVFPFSCTARNASVKLIAARHLNVVAKLASLDDVRLMKALLNEVTEDFVTAATSMSRKGVFRS